MFERFTDRARKVMALANQEAHRFGNEYIGTEHVLLGFIKEGGGAGLEILKNLTIDPNVLRAEVEKLIVRGSADTVVPLKLPPTPRANKVIALAIDEARTLNHATIGTEYLLVGLLREGESIAAQVLSQQGVRLDAARSEILRIERSTLTTRGQRSLDGGPRGWARGLGRSIRKAWKNLPPRPAR